jgi:hypothetical protein
MRNQLIFAIAVLFLLNCGYGLNWQGAGNWTTSNLTIIRNYINTNFSKSDSSSTVLTNFATTFSDYLNNLWDPAWNVVVVYINSLINVDSVLYGYAFRDHWMWSNGFLMDNGHYVSLIIWKDYNCITWLTFDSNLNYYTTFDHTTSSLIQTAIFNFPSKADKTDIWKTG